MILIIGSGLNLTLVRGILMNIDVTNRIEFSGCQRCMSPLLNVNDVVQPVEPSLLKSREQIF